MNYNDVFQNCENYNGGNLNNLFFSPKGPELVSRLWWHPSGLIPISGYRVKKIPSLPKYRSVWPSRLTGYSAAVYDEAGFGDFLKVRKKFSS